MLFCSLFTRKGLNTMLKLTLVSCLIQGSIIHRLDPELTRRLRFLVEFKMPDKSGRARIWQKMLPEKVGSLLHRCTFCCILCNFYCGFQPIFCFKSSKPWRPHVILRWQAPKSPNIDFEELGRRFDFTSGTISNAIVRAAAKVCLLTKPREYGRSQRKLNWMF